VSSRVRLLVGGYAKAWRDAKSPNNRVWKARNRRSPLNSLAIFWPAAHFSQQQLCNAQKRTPRGKISNQFLQTVWTRRKPEIPDSDFDFILIDLKYSRAVISWLLFIFSGLFQFVFISIVKATK
jgi:hypothetical protein